MRSTRDFAGETVVLRIPGCGVPASTKRHLLAPAAPCGKGRAVRYIPDPDLPGEDRGEPGPVAPDHLSRAAPGHTPY